MDVLVIYQFCTFGGVERAILNRAKAFRRHGMDVHIHIGYLKDLGALQSFQDNIRINGLEDAITAFVLPTKKNIDWGSYDLVSIIDTPQIFDQVMNLDNVFVECHTHYRENRQYLRKIPDNIRGILVPSATFKSQLRAEFPGLPAIHVIPNLVSDEFFQAEENPAAAVFSRRPITFFARLDPLKNFSEAVEIFESLLDEDNVMFFVIGHGAEEKARIQTLLRKSVLDRMLLRERISFSEVPYFTRLVKSHKGIFLSPSKGESFGLSAAEFLCSGVPVVLSRIPAHSDLVSGDERFLYELGNTGMAREKILAIWKDWEAMGKRAASYGEKFRGGAFTSAWMQFMEDQKLVGRTIAPA